MDHPPIEPPVVVRGLEFRLVLDDIDHPLVHVVQDVTPRYKVQLHLRHGLHNPVPFRVGVMEGDREGGSASGPRGDGGEVARRVPSDLGKDATLAEEVPRSQPAYRLGVVKSNVRVRLFLLLLLFPKPDSHAGVLVDLGLDHHPSLLPKNLYSTKPG